MVAVQSQVQAALVNLTSSKPLNFLLEVHLNVLTVVVVLPTILGSTFNRKRRLSHGSCRCLLGRHAAVVALLVNAASDLRP